MATLKLTVDLKFTDGRQGTTQKATGTTFELASGLDLVLEIGHVTGVPRS